MNGRTTPRGPWSTGGGLPSFTPAPQDMIVLLAVVFVTYSLQFFEGTAILPALLRLTPLVWRGFLWQLVTYPFSGYGGASIWILLELLILYWFGRDVYFRLGRKRFWTMIVVSAVAAAAVAELTYLVGALTGNAPPNAFLIMQGQRMLLTIFIAAFATLNRRATILLFFVLPIQAGWFLWLEILFAFIAFLGTHDLPGFLGITTAVAVTYGSLSAGGPGRMIREWRLRLERWRLQKELDRERRKRKMTVIDGGRGRNDESDDGPWIH